VIGPVQGIAVALVAGLEPSVVYRICALGVAEAMLTVCEPEKVPGAGLKDGVAASGSLIAMPAIATALVENPVALATASSVSVCLTVFRIWAPGATTPK
jgi:hypothetical protein